MYLIVIPIQSFKFNKKNFNKSMTVYLRLINAYLVPTFW